MPFAAVRLQSGPLLGHLLLPFKVAFPGALEKLDVAPCSAERFCLGLCHPAHLKTKRAGKVLTQIAGRLAGRKPKATLTTKASQRL